jgi:hypothetical protein
MSDETASQPRIKITWLIGTLAAFAIFVVVGAYSSRMTWDYTDYDQQRAAQRYDTLKQVQHDEQALISPVDDKGNPTAVWVDQAKGIIRIPIEEAMAKEVDTLKSQPAAIGAEIPAAAPVKAAPVAGAPASTVGATNAAPAKPAAPAAGPAAATAKPN